MRSSPGSRWRWTTRPGFEARLAEAGALARYAAFLNDVVGRYRTSNALRSGHPDLWTLFDTEERRLRRDHPVEWDQGAELLEAAELRLT